MSKMTPGPWSYDGHGINARSEGYLGDRIFKTCLDYSHGSVDRERAIADSIAVAAVPDMIQTLQEELEAIRVWLLKETNADITEGMFVSISKIKTALYEAGVR